MAQVKFYKVTAVPTTWEPDSFYYVEDAVNGYAESYITSSTGVPRAIGNSTMITELIGKNLGASAFKIVADITERDAIDTSAGVAFLVLVLDATGDPTVASGAALYAWNPTATAYEKVAEYESMDVTLEWANIQNKPTAPVAQIDAAATFVNGLTVTNAQINQAVADSHTHANKAVLDELNDDGSDNLTYKGVKVASIWSLLQW